MAILQARLTSSRLPRKVLMPILGRPMLIRQIERINKSTEIDCLVVATSSDVTDDPLVSMCSEYGIKCARGSLNNVLERFVAAARPFHPDIIVRFTGDCPLIDPVLTDLIIRNFLENDFDYISNCRPPTYPDGLEVMRFSCLEEADREAFLPSHREHVTIFIHSQPERFRLANFMDTVDRSNMRWTVDHLEDFEFVNKVYEALYPSKPNFTTQDILELIDRNPKLKLLNNHFKRGEGGRKSLLMDAKFITHDTME